MSVCDVWASLWSVLPCKLWNVTQQSNYQHGLINNVELRGLNKSQPVQSNQQHILKKAMLTSTAQ